MIGRWTWSPLSLIFCIPSGWDQVLRIKFVRSLPKGGRSRSNLFIMRFAGSPFPWKSLGEMRLLREWCFVWTTTLGKISIMDNLRKRYVILMDLCVQEGREIYFSFASPLRRDLWVSILSFWDKVAKGWWSYWLVGEDQFGSLCKIEVWKTVLLCITDI